MRELPPSRPVDEKAVARALYEPADVEPDLVLVLGPTADGRAVAGVGLAYGELVFLPVDLAHLGREHLAGAVDDFRAGAAAPRSRSRSSGRVRAGTIPARMRIPPRCVEELATAALRARSIADLAPPDQATPSHGDVGVSVLSATSGGRTSSVRPTASSSC